MFKSLPLMLFNISYSSNFHLKLTSLDYLLLSISQPESLLAPEAEGASEATGQVASRE